MKNEELSGRERIFDEPNKSEGRGTYLKFAGVELLKNGLFNYFMMRMMRSFIAGSAVGSTSLQFTKQIVIWPELHFLLKEILLPCPFLRR